MADAQGRGRGRARARAKPPGQQDQPRAPGPPPGMAKGTGGPLGPPPGMPAIQQPGSATSGLAMHRGGGRPIDEAVSGLPQKMAQMSMGGGNGNAGGDGAPIGRGNMRGKRQIYVPTTFTRPHTLTSKKGSSGRQITLQANYFPLVSQTDWSLYQYRVDFHPSIDTTPERRRLFRAIREKLQHAYLFDGTVMFCSYRLDPNIQNIRSLEPPNGLPGFVGGKYPASVNKFSLKEEVEKKNIVPGSIERTNAIGKIPMEVFVARSDDDPTQIRITIELKSTVEIGDAHYVQVFNILTRNALRNLNLNLINRNYFDPKAKVTIAEYHLEIWPGYSTTIRQHENNILMCANIESKVMRTDTCLHLLHDIVGNSASDYKNEFNKAVIGSVVLTDYNNRTYVISDVSWTDTPNSKFDRNGTATSYFEYYSTRYNIKLKDKDQPLLVSKSKPRDRRAREQGAVELPGTSDLIFLVPELCRLTGLTDEMRSNFSLMRAMAIHTRIGPKDRIDRLMTMNRRLCSEPKVLKEFKDWNMQLSNKLVDIPGRVLPMESIVLGGNEVVPAGEETDWTRHLRQKPMFSMPQGGLSHWVVIYPAKLYNDTGVFVDLLRQAARGMKFNIAEPEYVELVNDRTQSYVEKLEQVVANQNPQLIFVVLFKQVADKYSAVKKKSLVDRAVPTQVLVSRNLNNKKGGMSIATKVAIQINCKIGGAPWSVQMPLGGLMVIGFDVCHDSKAKGKSYGAMCASLNKPLSRYFSAVSHHSHGEELSNHIASNILLALKKYQGYNNTLPSHVIIYRDGVGDGQIPYVFTHEVEQIKKAMGDVYGQTVPKMAFIIVSKRINTRIFSGGANPKPGTVVDDIITLPERYDFFIISQFVNQGTVSPTSYNVIYDTLGLDPDKIQRLTYKMTHCYYNWSGTVRVPAPVQYAHKLAFLVSQSLHTIPNTELSDLLYFL